MSSSINIIDFFNRMEPPAKKQKIEKNGNLSEVDAQLSFGLDIPPSIVEACDSSEDELLLTEELEDPDDFSPFSSPRVFDLIAQHLSGDEVKAASLTCRKWNRMVVSSEKCMQKLLLLIDTTSQSNFDSLLNDILVSRRCYTNLEISLGTNDAKSARKVDRILKKFALSIVNLKLTKIGGRNSMLNKPLWLLKLESLELHVVCGRLTGEFLKNVCTLKKLTVNGLDPDGLLPCLQQNPQLEELTLYENSFISYFDRNLSLKLPFSLKKFSIFDHLSTNLPLQGEFPASRWNPRARLNFFKFLKTQASSLTSLHMDVCFAEDLNYIIKLLPLLECLEVNNIYGDLTKLHLEKNESIERFIASANGINSFLLYAIVASCVNLQSMFVFKLQVNQFLFVTRFACKLSKFGYFWALATGKTFGNSVNLKALHLNMVQVDEGINPHLFVQVMDKKAFVN